MTYFSNIKYCQLWQNEDKRIKICDLPVNSTLLHAGYETDKFTKVIYRASREFIGWVESVYLDKITYVLLHDLVRLDHQTESLQDLAQYVFVNGKLQYNLCGELCVCAILGISESELLEKWKAVPLSWYNRIFVNGLARTTGKNDLINMLSICQNKEIMDIKSAFPIEITPSRLLEVLNTGWRMIVGVHINRAGELMPSGILHWVVLFSAQANGKNSGWVTYYNPATNNEELSSWKEFSSSMGAPFGLLVRIIDVNQENNPG